ncbi:ATP phosphoribosyltransferase regulatory subunit [Sulfurivirga caldicuralii]|uniref:ATP phosphoribosyltransferase regulatory subunit n=1 Tax=Sulfurivirga caldicuralii TaxID=364032 RepID=A0A1N6F1H9_9GAMM|nr:ATP phosphoribosyltransferase regulatory subunit [Sulfurivirga caldicuralii]SIN89135.1 ATP phosphoribosyltransferase regulatory subunit [Sulfurivirga caldicuralii]
MTTTHIWFTPEGIEDLLPPQAEKLEFYRRELLDLFAASGYELIKPPIAEFFDSLLTGSGQDLSRETCTFVDQESGRTMGVRADTTPQVARIAASRLRAREGAPLRLCYAGDTLKARYNRARGTRNPYQTGVELFNVPGKAGDAEILLLLLESMDALGLAPITLSLGHAGLIKRVLSECSLPESEAGVLLTLLNRKRYPEYQAWLNANLHYIPYDLQALFTDWFELSGEAETVIDQTKSLLSAYPEMVAELDGMLDLLALLKAAAPHVRIFADLAEIRGYYYHTGLMFSTYVVDEHDRALVVARGGRYDGIAEAFDNPMSATGFSLDLRAVLDLLAPVERTGQRVWAPMEADPQLHEKVRDLRSEGYEVVWCEATPDGAVCKLSKINGLWTIENDEA